MRGTCGRNRAGAVDALEEITALLSRNPDELLSGNTAE